MNAAMRTGRKLGFADTPILEKDALLDRACEHTGLDDFGEDRWFDAKPASVRVKVRALKKLKDAAA